jgi:hypothetical protein
MTIILKDITNEGKITRLESCKYCLDKQGRPKPIWSDDMKHAKKMGDGMWMCGYCITTIYFQFHGLVYACIG